MKTPNVNLSSAIGVFAAVVEAGTFAAAADAMGLTPPGVSRAIARLETRLKLRLFARTTRSVSLTEEGRQFYEQVMPHVRGLEEAATAATQGAAAVRGKLRINLDPVFSAVLLGPRLDEFMDEYPALELEFIARDQLGDLVMDGFDLALRFGAPRPSSMVARKLLDTPVVTVAAPAYLAKRRPPAQPQDLEDGTHTCLEFRNAETGRPFPWEFHRGRRKLAVQTHGRLIVNEPGALLNACLAGSGIAQMLSICVRAPLAQGRLVALFPDWQDERYPLYAYYPTRKHVPARVRVFLDFIGRLTGALQD